MQTIVALDIETTGLDPDRDAIIEIGAVKFRGGRVEEEWSSLINPRRHVPEFITSLTGIDDAMLRQAPTFRDVIPILTAFVGEASILGHNVRFDLSFLGKQIPFAFNPVIDTYELASVLLPSASRYNLAALGKELGVLLPATHRALDDARVTHGVYTRLAERARELPTSLVGEIVALGEQVGWGGAALFEEIRGASPARPRVDEVVIRRKRKTVEPPAFPALVRPESPLPLDQDEAAAILEHGGPFAQYFGLFEQRAEQVQMLRAVTDALSRGQHLMVEAGTGVGKSFAYLIPAALFAIRNNTRVVISTNTINLQDQLIRKDIPDLAAALGLGLRASVLKGRSNYLCPRRLESARRFAPRSDVELRVLAKVLVWQLTESGGDRSTLNLNGNAEREVWLRLSAEDDGCTTETCIQRMGGTCPFQRAKMAAQSAHLLVVNHALLLADVAAEGKVLPEYDYLIVDEGHHLESATTAALSFRGTQAELERMVRDIGGSTSGILARLVVQAKESLAPAELGLLKKHVVRATDQAFRFEQLEREFFARLADFTQRLREGEPVNQYAWQARILAPTRLLEGWDAVEMAWEAADQALSHFLSTVGEVQQGVSSAHGGQDDDLDDVVADLSTAGRRLAEVEQQITALILKPNSEQIYWIEVRPGGSGVVLNTAPLRVGPLIERLLWHEKAAMILTSATLTTHGEFHYLRNALGADEANELQLGSPFDYEDSTLLFVANDMPEPNAPDYQQAVHRALAATARAAGGRTLALFTSYAALKKASQAISGPLARDDIVVFEQGEGASPNALLESFRSTDRAVLLGTRSFWEGVDVPGRALSVLIIPKLPFDVPTDPLVAARAETYEDPFGEFYVPEAILRFRQGFGRLIRATSDRGVVAILDRRILTKQYGRLFLESLPRCTLRQGPVAGLPAETKKWLGL